MDESTKKIEKILEDLFDKNYTTYEINIGKHIIIIRNITSDDYLKINDSLSKDLSTLAYSQEFILEKLSRIIVSIDSKSFTTMAHEDIKKYLKSVSSVLVNKIIQEHKKFENLIKKALDFEEVEKHFFVKDALQEKQEQLPKAST